jgi:hypothetical protein
LRSPHCSVIDATILSLPMVLPLRSAQLHSNASRNSFHPLQPCSHLLKAAVHIPTRSKCALKRAPDIELRAAYLRRDAVCIRTLPHRAAGSVALSSSISPLHFAWHALLPIQFDHPRRIVPVQNQTRLRRASALLSAPIPIGRIAYQHSRFSGGWSTRCQGLVSM